MLREGDISVCEEEERFFRELYWEVLFLSFFFSRDGFLLYSFFLLTRKMEWFIK